MGERERKRKKENDNDDDNEKIGKRGSNIKCSNTVLVKLTINDLNRLAKDG